MPLVNKRPPTNEFEYCQVQIGLALRVERLIVSLIFFNLVNKESWTFVIIFLITEARNEQVHKWSSVSKSELQQKQRIVAGYRSGRRCFKDSRVGSSSKNNFVLMAFRYDEANEVLLIERP